MALIFLSSTHLTHSYAKRFKLNRKRSLNGDEKKNHEKSRKMKVITMFQNLYEMNIIARYQHCIMTFFKTTPL